MPLFFGVSRGLVLLLVLPTLCFSCGVEKTVPEEEKHIMDFDGAIPTDGAEPFSVSQEFATTYTPGIENTASVTMEYSGVEPVTALALQITLPLGWQFGDLLDGAKPAITPKAGATGTVTLVWIQSPDFPATVKYTVSVPTWAEGAHVLEVQAIYRGLGGELRPPVSLVETTNPA